MKILRFQELNEKLGVSDEVIKTAQKVFDIIKSEHWDKVEKGTAFEFEFPDELYDEFMVDKVLIFDISFNPKYLKDENINGQMSTSVSDSGRYLAATLKLAITPTLSLITHEVQHMYEYGKRLRRVVKDGEVSGVFQKSGRRDWNYGFDEGSLGHRDKRISSFTNAVYYSLDEEMNSRVQEVYQDIKDEMDVKFDSDDDKKQHFIEAIKKNYNYKMAKQLQNIQWINSLYNDIDSDDEIYQFVNKMYYIFTRQYLYVNKDEPDNLLGQFVDSLDAAFRVGFEIYVKSIGWRTSKEISRRKAKKFLKQWDSHFKKQGKKFERKLFRLWAHFDTN